jgi:opacity protein-like surface antigen
MKTTLLCGAALASLLALQGTSSAADARRPVVVVPAASPWYASIFGGVAWPSTVVGQYYGSSSLDLQMDTGFIVGGTLGMYWHPNFRSEVELSFLHHDVNDDSFLVRPSNDGEIHGSVGAGFLMVNTWWQPSVMPFGHDVRPYIGGGFGVAWVRPDLTLYDDSDYVWDQTRLAPAAQFGVGIIWSHLGGIEWDLGYRAKAVLNTTFAAGDSCTFACSAVDVQWVDHVLQIGANFHF